MLREEAEFEEDGVLDRDLIELIVAFELGDTLRVEVLDPLSDDTPLLVRDEVILREALELPVEERVCVIDRVEVPDAVDEILPFTLAD